MIYKPGFQSWNIALQKDFHVIPEHENHALTFRAEAFNFTNHPNWDTCRRSNPTSGTFGQVTTKGRPTPRTVNCSSACGTPFKARLFLPGRLVLLPGAFFFHARPPHGARIA